MAESELHLLVMWPKALRAAKRILDDAQRRVEVVWVGEMSFPGDPAMAYRRFYGPSLPSERRKLAKCGAGKFLVAVVRDRNPRYEMTTEGGRACALCNVTLLEMKMLYRRWTGSCHRVHSTLSRAEFARDVEILTGRTAAEWERGVPLGRLEPQLPDGWTAVSSLEPFAAGSVLPAPAPQIDGARAFLENKYLNDRFLEGTWQGVPCVVKESSKAVWSIGNEYRLNAEVHALAPQCAPMPLAWRYAADGRSAWVVTAKVAGPSLTELLRSGLSADQADSFAADLLRLARALDKTGIVHRDLFSDNLLLDSDGHLKAIDWQLAVKRSLPREDPWVLRHWKFRYVVFGVNRELGLGVWNDFSALRSVLAQFPQTEAVRAADGMLAAREGEMAYSDPPRGVARVGLWVYALSLRIQMFFRPQKSRKYAQLERRWRTICGKWAKTAGGFGMLLAALLAGCGEERDERAGPSRGFAMVAETTRDGGVPADISGLAKDVDGTYWAVCDSRGELCHLDIRVDPVDGAVAGCRLLEILRVPGGDDMEGLADDPLRGTLWISDEAGPRIFEYDPRARRLGDELPLPASLRRSKRNRSLESVEITPDGLHLWTCNESPRPDGLLRIVHFSRDAAAADWKVADEWLYRPEAATHRKGRNGVASICALPDGALLVLEREKAPGDAPRFTARLYEIDFARATDASGRSDSDAGCAPVAKRKVFERRDSRSMYEGVCLGPVLADGSQTLLLVSDGDGGAAETVMTLRRAR